MRPATRTFATLALAAVLGGAACKSSTTPPPVGEAAAVPGAKVGVAPRDPAPALAMGDSTPQPVPPAPTGPFIQQIQVDPAHLDVEARRVAVQAAAEKKRVLVYFHASWCGPCKEVQKAFRRYQNAATFKDWYLAEVDVDALPDGPALGVDLELIPFFVKLDAKGKPDGSLAPDAFGTDGDPHMVDAAFHEFLAARPSAETDKRP